MSDRHYAIIIGLSNYPKFDPPANLLGPVNDAAAVRHWLRARGGVPEDNIWFRVSSSTRPRSARPTRRQLEDALIWLDRIAQKNDARSGGERAVGRRLYIYVAGHGFSPGARQGCLFTAEASAEQVQANVGISTWLQLLQDAGYFREYVLLMDCCMERTAPSVAIPPALALPKSIQPPATTFVAHAAQRPLKAVEVAIPEDGNRFHGAFTWAFLKGLEGAAVNRYGIVNGHSMANWLRNAIYPWLTEADLTAADVSRQPEIVAEDAGLVFATGVAPLQFNTALEFEADAIDNRVRLWSGVPPRAEEFTAARRVVRPLRAGLHVVEVPDAGYRQGFEIARDETIAVRDRGPRVNDADFGGIFDFTILSGDDRSWISIVAADFETLMSDGGRLTARLPAGIYKSVIRIGRELVRRVVLLDRHTRQEPMAETPAPDGAPDTAMKIEVEMPHFASAVPFPRAPNAHEYQADAARDAVKTIGSKRYHKQLGAGAELMIMARSWTARQDASVGEPWRGVKLVDEDGGELASLSDTGTHFTAGDPFAICRLSVAPGTYYLRHPFDGQTLEQALVVTEGWRLEAYLLRRKQDDTRPRLSMLMRRLGQHWGSGEDEMVEKARLALVDESPLPDGELRRLLTGKFANPLEGIMGAHLLLLARGNGRPGIDMRALNTVVGTLRTLVGDDHPDVEALSLACPDSDLRRARPILVPPLFERSWRLLVEASYDNPDLVPVELWRRQMAQAPVPPFLVWSVGERVRKNYESVLAAIMEHDRPPPADTGDATAPQPISADRKRRRHTILTGIPASGTDIMLDVGPMAVPEFELGLGAILPPVAEPGLDLGRMLQLPRSAIAALRNVSS